MADTPKLTVLFEKMRGKTFELNKDSMTVGRRDGMDICIKDPSLSGYHADIIRSERDGKTVYILRDHDSTNGTRINNVPITEQELKNSDIILFGGIEVLYDNSADSDNTISQTHTIDLSSIDSKTSTVPTLSNLDPFAMQEKARTAKNQKLMLLGMGLLGLLVVAMMVFALVRIVFLKEGN